MANDMTKGNPIKLIFLFAIPLFIGNIFQQIYNMADTFIVSRTIGVEALAAVGSTGSIMFLILGFAHGLTSGFAIPLSQKYGAKEYHQLNKSFGVSLMITFGIGSVLSIASMMLSRKLLEAMQTPPEIMEHAAKYIFIICSGILESMLYNLLSNILRAIGDSRTSLVFLIIASFINIALDLFFIVKLKMGVDGAALATVISQCFSVIACSIYIWRNLPMLHLKRESFKTTKEEVRHHLGIGFPMGFQMSIIAIGAIAIQITLNRLGSTAVAAYTASNKIDQVATMPMMSFGVAMATYAAQNYGAKKYERIWVGVRDTVKISVTYSFIVGILINLFSHHLIEIFIGKGQTEVLALSKWFFLTNSSIYFFLAMLFIYRYTLQGVGETRTPTIAGIIELSMRVFAAVILSKYFGFIGAIIANPLAWIGALIPMMWKYYRFKKAHTLQEFGGDLIVSEKN